MKVEIKYLRCENQFDRAIMYGQLFNAETNTLVLPGSLAQILQFVNENKLEIVNAQYVLDYVVRLNGFAC